MAEGAIRIGKVLHTTENGAAVVDWEGNASGPLVARSALGERRAGDTTPSAVVIAFEAGDLRRPVIVGVVHDALWAEPPVVGNAMPANVVVEARESLELRCGESRLEFDRSGRVTLRGREIVSRAKGLQRIKGATVEIN